MCVAFPPPTGMPKFDGIGRSCALSVCLLSGVCWCCCTTRPIRTAPWSRTAAPCNARLYRHFSRARKPSRWWQDTSIAMSAHSCREDVSGDGEADHACGWRQDRRRRHGGATGDLLSWWPPLRCARSSIFHFLPAAGGLAAAAMGSSTGWQQPQQIFETLDCFTLPCQGTTTGCPGGVHHGS